MIEIPLYQIDAFSSLPFQGNPAAVCLLPPGCNIDDSTRQQIAAEMNLSETAFVECPNNVNQQDDNNTLHPFRVGTRFKLRWFTPTIEVPLCGHATLAAAAAIFHENNLSDCVYFDTLSGELSVKKKQDNNNQQQPSLSMDLPLLPPTSQPHEMPCADFYNTDSLFITSIMKHIDREIDEICYERSLKYLVIVLKGTMTHQEFEQIQVDVGSMHEAHSDGHLVGVIITIHNSNTSDYDFLSRFFGPWAGITEDPVTGSAHSILGEVWQHRLNKKVLFARQCSKRGGELKLVVDGDRVVVSGGVFVVVKGTLCLP